LVLQGRGLTVFSETGFWLALDVVRQPDVAVVEEARLKDAKADDYLAGAPLLAIEVASPANTAEELDLKIDQYLRGRSQAVGWQIRSAKRLYGMRWAAAGSTRASIGLAKRFQRTSHLHLSSIRRSSFSGSWKALVSEHVPRFPCADAGRSGCIFIGMRRSISGAVSSAARFRWLIE